MQVFLNSDVLSFVYMIFYFLFFIFLGGGEDFVIYFLLEVALWEGSIWNDLSNFHQFSLPENISTNPLQHRDRDTKNDVTVSIKCFHPLQPF